MNLSLKYALARISHLNDNRMRAHRRAHTRRPHRAIGRKLLVHDVVERPHALTVNFLIGGIALIHGCGKGDLTLCCRCCRGVVDCKGHLARRICRLGVNRIRIRSVGLQRKAELRQVNRDGNAIDAFAVAFLHRLDALNRSGNRRSGSIGVSELRKSQLGRLSARLIRKRLRVPAFNLDVRSYNQLSVVSFRNHDEHRAHDAIVSNALVHIVRSTLRHVLLNAESVHLAHVVMRKHDAHIIAEHVSDSLRASACRRRGNGLRGQRAATCVHQTELNRRLAGAHIRRPAARRCSIRHGIPCVDGSNRKAELTVCHIAAGERLDNLQAALGLIVQAAVVDVVERTARRATQLRPYRQVARAIIGHVEDNRRLVGGILKTWNLTSLFVDAVRVHARLGKRDGAEAEVNLFAILGSLACQGSAHAGTVRTWGNRIVLITHGQRHLASNSINGVATAQRSASVQGNLLEHEGKRVAGVPIAAHQHLGKPGGISLLVRYRIGNVLVDEGCLCCRGRSLIPRSILRDFGLGAQRATAVIGHLNEHGVRRCVVRNRRLLVRIGRDNLSHREGKRLARVFLSEHEALKRLPRIGHARTTPIGVAHRQGIGALLHQTRLDQLRLGVGVTLALQGRNLEVELSLSHVAPVERLA